MERPNNSPEIQGWKPSPNRWVYGCMEPAATRRARQAFATPAARWTTSHASLGCSIQAQSEAEAVTMMTMM